MHTEGGLHHHPPMGGEPAEPHAMRPLEAEGSLEDCLSRACDVHSAVGGTQVAPTTHVTPEGEGVPRPGHGERRSEGVRCHGAGGWGGPSHAREGLVGETGRRGEGARAVD
jgi:hypothetical protein